MGIVGLPNVGKSTLFNALTKTAAAQAANFPFCTIEPNVGEVAVPDGRLDTLAKIAHSNQIIPTRMTFVDIAGLVKGASKGEGLGNQFLANIREVDAIAHVLRCFDDKDVTHVDDRINPVEDAETIETELMLADIESIEKRMAGLVRKIRGGDKEAVEQDRLLKLAMDALEQGQPARSVDISGDDSVAWKNLQLLTSKPTLFVCNVDEDSASSGNNYSKEVEKMAAEQGAGTVRRRAGAAEVHARPRRRRRRYDDGPAARRGGVPQDRGSAREEGLPRRGRGCLPPFAGGVRGGQRARERRRRGRQLSRRLPPGGRRGVAGSGQASLVVRGIH